MGAPNQPTSEGVGPWGGSESMPNAPDQPQEQSWDKIGAEVESPSEAANEDE